MPSNRSAAEPQPVVGRTCLDEELLRRRVQVGREGRSPPTHGASPARRRPTAGVGPRRRVGGLPPRAGRTESSRRSVSTSRMRHLRPASISISPGAKGFSPGTCPIARPPSAMTLYSSGDMNTAKMSRLSRRRSPAGPASSVPSRACSSRPTSGSPIRRRSRLNSSASTPEKIPLRTRMSHASAGVDAAPLADQRHDLVEQR